MQEDIITSSLQRYLHPDRVADYEEPTRELLADLRSFPGFKKAFETALGSAIQDPAYPWRAAWKFADRIANDDDEARDWARIELWDALFEASTFEPQQLSAAVALEVQGLIGALDSFLGECIGPGRVDEQKLENISVRIRQLGVLLADQPMVPKSLVAAFSKSISRLEGNAWGYFRSNAEVSKALLQASSALREHFDELLNR